MSEISRRDFAKKSTAAAAGFMLGAAVGLHANPLEQTRILVDLPGRDHLVID